MSDSTKVATALREASTHLQRYGWVRGSFYRPQTAVRPRIKPIAQADAIASNLDLEIETFLDYDHAPACSLGALAQVTGAREVFMRGQAPDTGLFLANDTGVKSVGEPHVDLYLMAGKALRDYLELEVGAAAAPSVPSWNDGRAQGAQQVILMFERAADYVQANGLEGLTRAVNRKRQAEQIAYRKAMEAAQQANSKAVAKIEVSLTNMETNAKAMTEALEKMKATLSTMAIEVAEQAGVPAALLGGASEPTPEVDAVDALEGAMAIVNAASVPEAVAA